jgi:translocation and assembly module TamA
MMATLAERAQQPGHTVRAGAPVFVALLLAMASCTAARLTAQEARVRIDLQGLQGDLRRNALAAMGMAAAAGGGPLPEARVRSLHARAPREIELALQPYGRYSLRVEPSLAFDGRRWVARYVVDPGPAIQVVRVDVRVEGPGEADSGFADALAAFPLSPGNDLSHPRYEAGKLALETVAAERGYLDAAFTQNEIRVDLERGIAEILIRYRTGPRYLLGDVIFLQDVLDPALLESLVPFRPGDPYDAALLLQLQTALAEGPYFGSVEIRPRRDQADGPLVPIEVTLSPRKPQRFAVGGGYGTDTGPRGTFGFELRRVNRQGHRAEGEIRGSAIERRATARYLLPWGRPHSGLLTFTGAFADLDPKTSESRTYLVGTSLARLMGGWRQTVSLTFQRERYEVGIDEGTSTLLIPGAGWSRVRADDRVYPTRGSRVGFGIRGAHDQLLADASFLQLEARAKWVRTPVDHLRLIARSELGYLRTSDFHALPPSIRYFTGGDQSVRGFGYESLTPRDPAGNATGGDRLVVVSLELEGRVRDKWSVAAFFDAGNALRSLSGRLERGVGGGVRWRSPIGLIRLDGAFAISRDGSPFRLHVIIGPDL